MNYSEASNLVPGDTNNTSDIFVKDLATDAAGAEANGGNSEPVFSPDGSKVAFRSSASNLVPGDTNNTTDIFIKDLATGAILRVSTDAFGVEGNHSSYGEHETRLAFSPDGSRLAFSGNASNLVPGDTNTKSDIFIVELTGTSFLPDGQDVEFSGETWV